MAESKLLQTIETNLSEVKIFTDRVYKRYMIKKCNSDEQYDSLTGEMFILNLLDDADGFPKVLDFVREYPYFTIILNNLGEPLHTFNWSESSKQTIDDIFIQILKLIADLHTSKIVHADLKPANILCKSSEPGKYELSIIDFSHSLIMTKYFSDKYSLADTNEPCTYIYKSPITNRRLDEKHDIWSLGCILFELITGEFFIADDIKSIDEFYDCMSKIETIKKKQLSKITDPKYVEIIKRMLSYKSKNRPSAVEILEYFGVKYESRQFFEIHDFKHSHQSINYRPSCFLLDNTVQRTLRYHVDNFITQIESELFDTFPEKHKKEYDKNDDIGELKKLLTQFDTYIMIHAMIVSSFLRVDYNPYGNYISNAKNYMDILWNLWKHYHFSAIFSGQS